MVKLVTVLFADVVGSTAQAERMQPDDTRALMTDFFTAMSEEIQSEGGTVERIIGDAVMADFGVPVSHEDDPLRAVRAARRMLRRLEEWNRPRGAEERIQIRVGINTGRVSAAGDGGADLLVTGDAVNVAARLEQSATPGSILVGERTARAIAGIYRLTEQDLVLKGKSEPVRAFVVGDELNLPTHVDRTDALVGRTTELEVLSNALDRAVHEAHAQLVTVVGEAGIGKSRLVEEFAAAVRDVSNARVVQGRCLPYGEGVTLWPLGEVLKAEAGILGSDSSKAAITKIESLVSDRLRGVVSEEAPATTALASTIGWHDETAAGSGDPRQVYRDLLTTWRLLLGVMGRDAPLVVIVEDLHWADATMLDVLSYLADHIDAGVLFVCPTRPEVFQNRSWGVGIRSYSSLALHPLSSEESEQLLSRYVGESFPEGLKRRILERSEGNPFFLKEMIGSLRDQGYLGPDLEWTGQRTDAEIEVPDNVQSVILSRIDILPSLEKTVLQQASVVGRTFWIDALTTLVDEDGVEDALLSLERRGLVTQRLASTLAGELEYVFVHVLIKDVAADTLPRRARAESHAKVARWLVAKTGDRAAEYAELLAHHYEQAFMLTKDESLRSKAREFCVLAARTAMRRAATSQARALATRALELSATVPDRADALELLGDIHHFNHDGDAAWEAFTAAIRECEEGDVPDRVAPIASKAAILVTRWEGTLRTPVPAEEVRAVIDKGVAALTPLQARERSLLLCSRAFLQGQGYEQSDSAGEDAARQALAIAEELGDADLISTALDASAFWLLPEARYGEIDRIERRRLDLVPHLTDSREISDVFAVAALSATFMGRYRDAARLSEDALERARGMDPGQYLYCLSWRTLTRFLSGDWDGALSDQAEVEDLESKDSDALPLPYAAAPYAATMLCHELRGKTEEASAYLDLLNRYRHRQGARGAPIGITRMLAALTVAHRGDYEAAWQWINLERSPYLGANIAAACELAAWWDDPDKSWDIVRLARAESERTGSDALRLHADRLEARVAGGRGDLESAARLLDDAALRFQALGAPWDEAWSLLLLARLLSGADPAGASPRAARGATIFESLGSVSEAAESRSLVGRRR